MIALVLIVASRGAIKQMLAALSKQQLQPQEKARDVLIYGAGKAGHMLAQELKRVGTHQPIYFVDDDPSLWDQKVGRLKVRSPEDIPKVLAEKQVQDIFLAMPSLSSKRRREIILSLENHPVSVKTVPSISEIVKDNVAISNVRPINAGDLLCRDPVPPKLEILQQAINGKSVLVTGAGGSIRFLRLSISFCGWNSVPRGIVLYELSEAAPLPG